MSARRSLAALMLGLILHKAVSLAADKQLPGRALQPDKAINSIAVTADGRWLVTGSLEETRLWPLRADDPLAEYVVLRGAAGPVSPDGERLMTVGKDRVIRLWDLKADDPSRSQLELARFDLGWTPLRGIALSPDGRWLVTIGGDRALRLWDLKGRDGKVQSRVLLEHQADRVILTPDGRWLTTGSSSGRVGVWDLAAADPAATGVVRQIREGQFAGSAGLSADGRWLAAAGVPRPERHLWDLSAKDPWVGPIAKLGTTERVRSLDFSRDGKLLATGGDDGHTRLYDLTRAESATKPRTLEGSASGGGVREVAFSPDGRWLVTGQRDGTVRLWDVRGGTPPGGSLVFKGHTAPVEFVAVSPNSRWLLSGANVPNGNIDPAVRVWDLNPSEPTLVAVLEGHTGALQQVVFSPDGRWVATRTSDNRARLWALAADE